MPKKPKNKNERNINKDEIEKTLKKLGTNIYDALDASQFPNIEIPSRSVKNIIYDKETKQYILDYQDFHD